MVISKTGYISISLDLKSKARALAVQLYTSKGIASHRIAQAFKEYGIPISTKTIIKAVKAKNEANVRGFDPYHKKQTYSWVKFTGKYRNWYRGKTTAPMTKIIRAFWAWFAYSRLYGIFDLEAILEGEKPP